jgi:hypothetical protein
MAKKISDRIFQVKGQPGTNSRFDRILLKTKDDFWRTTTSELLGTSPVFKSEKGEDIFASDHFGVTATIALSSTVNNKHTILPPDQGNKKDEALFNK